MLQSRTEFHRQCNGSSHLLQKFRGKISITVFLDVRGAIDNATHSAVLEGFKTIGMKGRLYHRIADYLHTRTIFMRTREGDTIQHVLKKGVQQGGVLTPVLFNVALIGIFEVFCKSTDITLYADDICLWTSAISLKSIQTRFLVHLLAYLRFWWCANLKFHLKRLLLFRSHESKRIDTR